MPITRLRTTGVPPEAARKAVALAAVCLGQFLIQLDLTVVDVALPSIGTDLHASVSGLQWVVDGYNLAVASLLLIGGRLGDRVGHRRIYLSGVLVFGVGSAMCAVASGTGVLIGCRVLQGIGAAIELPASLAIVTRTFTEERERAQAVGVWTSVAGSSLVVGPMLGGVLIAAFGWRAVFVVNLPLVALIVALTAAAVPVLPGRHTSGLDLPGQMLGSAALAALTGGAIEGGHLGFGHPLPRWLLAIGVAGLIGFVVVEHRHRDPVLPLGLFRRAAYTAANACGLAMGFVTIGLLFVFALFFQQAQHLSAVAAGLRFVPLTAAFVLTGPLIGRMLPRVGPRTPMTVGAAALAAGALALTRVHAGTGYAHVWVPFLVLGVGYGLLSTPMAAAVLGAVPSRHAGMASSTNLTARWIGGVFGIAVLGALLPASGTAGFDSRFGAGLRAGMLVAAAVALAGAALAAAALGRPGPSADPDSDPDLSAAPHRQ